MKKQVLLILAVVSTLAAPVFADTETVDGITWTYSVSGGEASVYNKYVYNKFYDEYYYEAAIPTSTKGAVTVPSSLGGHPVTSIGGGAFSGCSSLTTITIPNSVTNIGSDAFYNCSGLMAITIPDRVTSIGGMAFYNCSGLTSITIPDGVRGIWNSAFYGCTGLTSITIPDSVTSIGDSTFYKCSGLTSITIGNGVTSIGSYAFGWCSGLTALTIPDSVTSIGSYAFNGCSGLTSIKITNGETTVANGAFGGCSKLTDIEIPQCICSTNLSAYFPSWRTMTNIVVSEGVGYIADSAFEGCSWLESVTVPWTVTRIGQRAFYDCIRLREVVFEGDAPDRIGEDVFGGTQRSLVCRVPEQSIGWDGGFTPTLPDSWHGRSVATGSQEGHGGGTSVAGDTSVVRLCVSNIVVHYVTQSMQSDAVIPPTTSGIVNVMTEVGSGDVLAIPSDWAAQYPGFEAKFGSDIGAAVVAETGKRDGAGNPMLVWQDYVAGTDPTDPDDVFTASITFDAETGEPVISWSPELTEAEAAKRTYRIYGKVRLTDEDWTEIPEGEEGGYNFFKVSVEMR